MKRLLLFLPALAVAAPVALRTVPESALLQGAGAAQRFLAIARDVDGAERDVTAEVKWTVTQPVLATLTAPSLVRATADGSAEVRATLGSLRAESKLRVEGAKTPRPFYFARDVGGIFTKRGCNSSICHGGVKGQGGFKLSANGLYPKDDYDWTVKGGTYQVLTNEVKGERKPRIDTADPAKSLLLQKATGTVPHGGGKRFAATDDDYRTLFHWIASAAPYGSEANAKASEIARLDVFPSMAAMPAGATHRLLVTAHFADGHREDFTDQVLYASNNGDVAQVDAAGIVTAKKLGETAILIRAAGQVASAGVGVIGSSIANYPAVPRNNFIDDHIFAKLRKVRLIPSDLATDGEFLRRACLDLTGTLPPPERVREFLASTDPRKREKVVDALVASPEFTDYWTFRFSDIFRVAIFANGLTPKWSQKYWEWIRANVESNRPYNEVAFERIAAQGYGPASRHFLPYNQIGTAADTMAEEVRVFFGRRMDCAQCHNHPYENWSQDQFWGMAAFFGRLFKMGPVVFDHPTNMDLSSKDVDGKVETVHPRTKARVHPSFLDGKASTHAGDANPRKALAEWMTRHPYFAEAAVNRLWGYFFGRGIVDPVDDFRTTNPPTHPELLAALADHFVKSGYDLRQLMRTIAASRTYQLSHRPNESNREDVVNYSRSLARAIDAEVLLDAVVDTTGVPETFTTAVSEGGAVGQATAGTRAINLKDPDMFFSRFLELYGRPNRGAIPERSGKPNLAQALHMLAGSTYVNRLSSRPSRLERLLSSGAGNTQIFEEFYLAALARHPSAEEISALDALVTRRGEREPALREFVWALISSREFAENH